MPAAERPQKPDPYLTAYMGTLMGLFQLWDTASRPIRQSFDAHASDDAITPHIDYLEHIRQATATIAAPAAAQRALVTLMQSHDQFRALLAKDDENEQYGRNLMEDYAVFRTALDAFAQQAERYEY